MKQNSKTLKAENIVISDNVIDDFDVEQPGNDSVKEVKISKKKKSSRFILLYIAIGVFTIYAVYALITQYSQINSKQSELDSLNEQISVQEIKNDELTDIYNLSDKDNEDYIEEKAKEDGYLHQGERVFVNISGD